MADAVVEQLRDATPVAVEQIGALIPQLTPNFVVLTLGQLRRVLEMPGAVYVARVDGRIVGTVQRIDVSHCVRTKCWIEDFVVDEAFRGQGIATRLIEMAISEAPAEATSINLTSNSSRVGSHRLYAKLGFERREDTNMWRLGR